MKKSFKERIGAIHERDQLWMELDEDLGIIQGICNKIDNEGELTPEEVDIAAKCIKTVCGELLFRRAERLLMEDEL